MGIVVEEKDVVEKDVMDIMRKRVDRLMKAVHLEVEDGDLRIEAVTKLLEVRRLFDDERNSN